MVAVIGLLAVVAGVSIGALLAADNKDTSKIRAFTAVLVSAVLATAAVGIWG